METLLQITERKADIEEELRACLEEAQADFTLEEIKRFIYYADNYYYDFDEVVTMFEESLGFVDTSQLFSVLSYAWQYFPHYDLSDLSPAEYWSGVGLKESYKLCETL